MKQVLLDNTLYVLRKEPYVINQDVENASVILVNCNTIEGFKLLNPTLDLTAFNYLVIRKWTAPYYQYVDQLDDAPFYFDVGIQNVSSYVDLSYTGLRQTPVTPDDLDVSLVYYFNDVLMDSSAFTLTEPGQYKISAEIKDSSKYLDELQTYIINYEKVKRDCTLSFATASYEVSTYKDENYTGSIQQVSGIPQGETVNYYIGNSLLSGNSITLTEPGFYVVSARLEDSSIYNDTSTSYTISYQKQKRTATLSFANAVVNETVEDVTEYTGQVQLVSAPQNVSINYYLGDTLLYDGAISIDNLEEGENTYLIYAKIENDDIYNNATASYTLNITMEISSYENKYLTFESLADGNTFQFTKAGLSYSTDKGKTWAELPVNTSTPEIDNGEKILFKGSGIYLSESQNFISSGNFNVEGNIMSLVYADNFKQQTNINGIKFTYLFYKSKIINAENLILPATIASYQCYHFMFRDCSLLTTAPELPATSLGGSCYMGMFYNCKSLTTAPELPVTTLYSSCYLSMFYGCSSLNYIKAACPPVLTYDKNNWVQGVAATGTYIISDPNYNPNDGVAYGTSAVPNGWTIKDYQGNVINPKVIVQFTNSNSLTNKTPINEQFTIPSYQIKTTPSAALNEVVYSYSTDNTNWSTTIPQYLDTTAVGTFTYYIKAEISNSTSYTDKSEVYTYTYTVKDAITDFSDYVRLDQIENVDSLLDTETLRFNDFVLDLSSTLTNGNNVYVQLRDTVTNQTSDSYNGIRTFSASGRYDFNVRENSNNYKIQEAGDYVSGQTGFYHYHFTNLMQIFAIQSNVNRSKIYFKLPNYKQNLTLSFTNSTVDVSTYSDENYYGTIQTANGIPSGVTANYYLNSSLLANKNITLTTAGTYTIKAAIENDANYNDTSTSYTLNYTKVKRDVSNLEVVFYRNGSTVNNETFNQNETVARPQFDVIISPANVLYNTQYSTDGVNYTNIQAGTIPDHLSTTTIGTYTIYIKATVISPSYNTSTAIGTYTYNVAAAKQNLNLRFTDESDSPIRNLYIIEQQLGESEVQERHLIGAYQQEQTPDIAYGPDIYLELPSDLDVSVNWYIDASYGNNVVPLDFNRGQYAMQPGYLENSYYDENLDDYVEYNYDFELYWSHPEESLETELSDGDILDFIVRAKVENSSIYNDTSIFYIIRLTKVADAVGEYVCPECGEQDYTDNGDDTLTCNNCGHTWNPYEESEEEPEGGE